MIRTTYIFFAVITGLQVLTCPAFVLANSPQPGASEHEVQHQHTRQSQDLDVATVQQGIRQADIPTPVVQASGELDEVKVEKSSKPSKAADVDRSSNAPMNIGTPPGVSNPRVARKTKTNSPTLVEPNRLDAKLIEELEEQSVLISKKENPLIDHLSPEMRDLRNRIQHCIGHYKSKLESASSRSPWGIMHTLISYGVETKIYANGRKANAIGWLCWNGSCRGQRLFFLTRNGIDVRQGPGVEGHKGQFLAMLAQSKVMRDYPMRVEGRSLTVEDLIEHEKLTCRPKTELTFKLIGLAHYLDSDATWKNDIGQEWSIPHLIREELAQPVVGAACGGTHRMMGFAYAVNRRKKQDKEISGQWNRAEQYVKDFQDYTFRMQNPDGSFSTNWFEGRGNHGGIAKKLQTTGHILEWLVYSLPEEELQSERVFRAANLLTNLMNNNSNYPWEVGPRGHALRALVLYNKRVFESPTTIEDSSELAEKKSETTTK